VFRFGVTKLLSFGCYMTYKTKQKKITELIKH